MKKILLVFLIICISIIANAEITYGIFPSLVYLENGFFIAPHARLSTINSEANFHLGPRLGWVINHKLIIGSSYNWNLSYPKIYQAHPDSSYYAKSEYGGLEIEYNFFPFQPVHFSIYNLVGFGGLDILLNKNKNIEEEDFFIFEPGIFLKINLTDICHVASGITYRYIDKLKNTNISEKDLGGFTANLAFKFGWF
jgi:hypothetical protein